MFYDGAFSCPLADVEEHGKNTSEAGIVFFDLQNELSFLMQNHLCIQRWPYRPPLLGT